MSLRKQLLTISIVIGTSETLFNMSVQDMGNYQEYLKRLPQPLREIETQPARQHTFGNPFKVNKVSSVLYSASYFYFMATKHNNYHAFCLNVKFLTVLGSCCSSNALVMFT